MIRGLHGLFYSSDPEATRAFLRDQLRLPYADVGEGWLIFDLPEGDLGVHPVDASEQPPPGSHDISFYCDDIEGTVADLRARGVAFTEEIADRGYGWVTHFSMPGGIDVQLYEPRYVKGSSGTPRAPRKPPSRRTPAAKTRAPAPKRGGTAARRKRRTR